MILIGPHAPLRPFAVHLQRVKIAARGRLRAGRAHAQQQRQNQRRKNPEFPLHVFSSIHAWVFSPESTSVPFSSMKYHTPSFFTAARPSLKRVAFS